MKQTNENITVKLARPERTYVKVYHDFLDNTFLTAEEQMIFIVLKSYIDFKEDSGEVYPSIETICKRAKMSPKRVRKNINSLVQKKIVTKVQRGLTKTNLYTLSDHATTWICDSANDTEAIEKPLTAEEHIAALQRMGYKVELEEKKIVCEPQKEHTQKNKNNNLDVNKDNIKESECQAKERYTTEQIHQLFDYDIMIQDYPDQQPDIDAVMNILHTTMNTSKNIRVARQDMPCKVVIGKLLKLNKDTIMYAIDQFSGQTELIKNPTAYLLTILYQAPEQYQLYLKRKASHNSEKAEYDRKDQKMNITNGLPLNLFCNFHQREYDYEKLERKLLENQQETEYVEPDIIENQQNQQETKYIDPEIEEMMNKRKRHVKSTGYSIETTCVI